MRKYVPLQIAASVSCITLLVYLAALRNDFVLWDDDAVVYNNIIIRSLNGEFFKWAFTNVSISLWQPLVWIFHAVDYALWGLKPAGYHFTNILLHTANTFLSVILTMRLFQAGNTRSLRSVAVAGMGGVGGAKKALGQDLSLLQGERAMLISAGVAGLFFGLHPLHVESAAWVIGRTDLLCTLFFLLSVLAYVGFAAGEVRADAQPSKAYFRNNSYYLSVVFCILALASKPMAITLPFVLVLLDWYPLNRIRSLKNLISSIREKVPFIGLAIAASIVAVLGQAATGDLAVSADVPLSTRVLVAAKALALYLGKTALPAHLSPFYPYPKDISLFSFEYGMSLALVCGITIACVLRIKKVKVLSAVWFYYLCTLLPVLGLVKVRSTYIADRYAYLPSLGPFLLIGLAAAWVWSRMDGLKRHRLLLKRIAAAAAVLLCMLMVFLTLRQIGVWENSITLWNRVIEEEPERVPTAYHNRGLAFKELGQFDRALSDYTKAIALEEGKHANTFNSRGLVFHELGQYDQALKDFDTAVVLDPKFSDAYTSRGWTFKELGQTALAIRDFNTALALDPLRPIPYNNRGMVFQEAGQLDKAIADYTEAITLNPYFAQAYTNRGLAYEQAGRIEPAFEDYNAAIHADPGFANAYNNRGLIFERTGRLEQALEDLTAAIRLNPSGVEAYNNRGLVYEDLGRLDRAIEDYSKAIELKPDDYFSYSNRGTALGKTGRFDKAVEDHTETLILKPDFAQAYLDRGDCYGAMGDDEKALIDYRKACVLGMQKGCEAARRYATR